MKKPKGLFLDVIDMVVTFVDHEPVHGTHRLRFMSNGRILASQDFGRWKSATEEEAISLVAPIVRKYGILKKVEERCREHRR